MCKPVSLVDIPEGTRMNPRLERRLPKYRSRCHDLTGNQYGKNTIIGFAGFIGCYSAWLVKCDCGTYFIARENSFSISRKKPTMSCGCLLKAAGGVSRSFYREYAHYRKLLSACTDESDMNYWLYGGQGYTICESWQQSFENFLRDVGPKPDDKSKTTLVPVGKEYKPGAYWGTRKSTMRAAKYTANGLTLTVRGWAENIGVSRQYIDFLLRKARHKGITLDKVLVKKESTQERSLYASADSSV